MPDAAVSASRPSAAVQVHAAADDVGVAVGDLVAGTSVSVRLLDGQALPSVQSRNAIPLGHKIALRSLRQGQPVREYGEIIGVAMADIESGSHVHVHNLRSRRWPGGKE